MKVWNLNPKLHRPDPDTKLDTEGNREFKVYEDGFGLIVQYATVLIDCGIP